MQGGDSGAVISPGKPAASLLLTALRYDGMEMPPDQPLPANIIRDFEKWIQAGAAMPTVPHSGEPTTESTEKPKINWQQARQFWAFQPPTLHDPAEIESAGNDISASDSLAGWAEVKHDRFVAARLKQEGLRPNPPAAKRTWLRRVTFDLVGLPPTIQEFTEFEYNQSPFAKEHVVDRLLASPKHAERWARIWLDVARYAEDQAHVVGANDSLTYPNAYLYRDWVIDALAADMPYDEFIRMQLAADLLRPQDSRSHVALGFVGLGPKYYRRNDLEVMSDEWEDRIDTVSRGLLGLTVACARCHDHKYDPIPTSDYYAMAGVFASTEMYNRPLNESVEQENGQAKKPQDAIHIVRDGKLQDLNVMIRGDVKRLGPKVQRGFLTIFGGSGIVPVQDGGYSSSGRKELANAITERSNPLVARVIVNRVWKQLMGSAIVDTPSNFGALGSRPTHPLLLDDLSVRLMDAGWSLKWLQREIVLSATYGQSSDVHSPGVDSDPGNRLRWRMPRRRLSIEAYRDAILSVTGSLDSKLGGRSIDPQDAASSRRTVYSKVSRLGLNPMLARFDFPDPNAHSPGRHETTTPLQKLFLLNSPFLVHYSAMLAEQAQQAGTSDPERITFAYRLLFGRKPSHTELRLAQDFVASDNKDRWSSLAQTLLISNEMFMLD